MIPNEFSIEGKVAIVTGAGRGIGKAISLVLAEAGADIVVAARTKDQIEKTAKEIDDLGQRVLAIPTDVTKADQVEHLVETTISEFGRIDILVNNAGASRPRQLIPLPGIKLPRWQRVDDLNTSISEEEWRLVLDSNLTSTFICTKAVGPHMIQQRKGKVINISSVAAESGGAYFSSYDTSKAAVSMFTRCIALEWAPFNINVNAIGPGFFHTQMTAKEHETPDLREQMHSSVPLGRAGETREIGLLALYLASNASNYLTGQTIFLDGGLLAR
jgi:NAD(P)-dependent dehydrogenase (short-subunit alcohol dehydrogenase family)